MLCLEDDTGSHNVESALGPLSRARPVLAALGQDFLMDASRPHFLEESSDAGRTDTSSVGDGRDVNAAVMKVGSV